MISRWIVSFPVADQLWRSTEGAVHPHGAVGTMCWIYGEPAPRWYRDANGNENAVTLRDALAIALLGGNRRRPVTAVMGRELVRRKRLI